MVFSNSLSDYFDPPNWNLQQGNQQQQSGIIIPTDNPHQILSSPAAPPSAGSGGAGSIRPGSMLDRARLARVPLPEPGLKCPRCDSSNTKFCYFNNYNLSQPRHFCKACRRYWTRGGALRNVPVGGGYRRNKRKKGRVSDTASSKSAHTSTNTNTTSTNGNSNGFASQMVLPQPYMPGLHNLNEYMSGFGLNLGGGGPLQFDAGGCSSNSGVSRVHHLSNLLPGSGLAGVIGNGLYPFHHESITTTTTAAASTDLDHASGFVGQISRVKAEDGTHGFNLSKNFIMGIDQPNDDDDDDDDQYHNWGSGSGNGWTDILGFQAPSSAGNLL